MAKDKLFQRRRAERAEAEKRKAKKRSEKRRFLIVCEGKTEETYFQFYVDQQESLVAEVTSECGTSPMCVTSHAISLAEKDGDYDEVFAVFDGDTPDTGNFDRALTAANESENFMAIHSTPCFEYWLWLHFKYSTKPFVGIKNARSAGTQMLSELKSCSGMSEYVKGEQLNFPAFIGKLDTALNHAKRVEKHSTEVGERNPSTKVHHLIKAIENIEDDITTE